MNQHKLSTATSMPGGFEVNRIASYMPKSKKKAGPCNPKKTQAPASQSKGGY